VFLCRNKAYRSVRNQLEQAELLANLERMSVDPAMYATAVEDAHGAHDGSKSAEQLTDAFGARRTAQESLQLAGLLRSRGLPGLGEHADRLITRVYACRPGPEIAQLIHLLHLRNGPDIDVGQVLTVLSSKEEPRPAAVLAAVSAALGGMECADCYAIRRRLDDGMLTHWPPSRMDELLGAPFASGGKGRHGR